MSPDWRFALSDPALWERLASPRSLGLALWIGLAALTVSLVLLMRTRWGQTKPLSKCVVLSVFAHILFLGYASGTKLVFDYPNAPRDEVLQLALLAPSENAEDQPQQIADDWEETFASSPMEVAVESPARKENERSPLLEDAPTGAPDMPRQPHAIPSASGDLLREMAPAPKPAQPALSRAAPAEMTVEPAPVPPESQAEPKPESTSPRRLASESPPNQDAGLNADSPPDELMSDAGRLQRLSDISIQSATASAAPGSRGEPRAADNLDGNGDAMNPSPLTVGAQGRWLDSWRQFPRCGDSAIACRCRTCSSCEMRLTGFVSRSNWEAARAEEAVQSALAWLAANQESDGRWDAAKHGGATETKALGHDRQHAGIGADAGITGLALLAFLGAGQTHYEGAYRKNVQRGLEYLISVQKEDGCLSGDARLYARMYCHGIAAFAISEAMAMTGDDRLQPHVERAIHYTVAAQHEGTGGWRYQPGDVGDTSQFGWQILAIRSAQLAGVDVPQRTRVGAERFLASVTSGAKRGLASYRAGEQPTRSMTAEALLCRLFLGQRDEPALREAVDFIMKETPRDGSVNMYYWYYATLSLFQIQGDQWDQWNKSLQEQLLRLQRTDSPLDGSWDPDAMWGGYGGRVYSTALAAMCLEVYYRYLPILGKTE